MGPLIEAVRPHGRMPPLELRQTIAATFWRHGNGAKWRAAPLFIRWAAKGAWERLLTMVQERAGGPELRA